MGVPGGQKGCRVACSARGCLQVEGGLWETTGGPPEGQRIFFRCRWMPLLDLRTICDVSTGGLDGLGSSSKRSRVRATATFISFMANCCPMQFLGRG